MIELIDKKDFTMADYQQLAMRTASAPTKQEMLYHGAFGLVSEVCELEDAIRDEDSNEHVILEMGDVLWMMAEICEATGLSFNEIYVNLGVSQHPFSPAAQFDRMQIGYFAVCNAIQKTWQGDTKINSKITAGLNSIMDALYGLANLLDITLPEVAQRNIEKLIKRFPLDEGFTVERSLHRAEGDI